MLLVHFAAVLSASKTPPVKAWVIQDLRCPINFFQPPAKSRCRRRLKAKCLINIKFIRFSITESIVKLKKQLILWLLCIPLLWSLICDIKSPTVKILQLYYTCSMVKRKEKRNRALGWGHSHWCRSAPQAGIIQSNLMDRPQHHGTHPPHHPFLESSDGQTATGHLQLKTKY